MFHSLYNVFNWTSITSGNYKVSCISAICLFRNLKSCENLLLRVVFVNKNI